MKTFTTEVILFYVNLQLDIDIIIDNAFIFRSSFLRIWTRFQ